MNSIDKLKAEHPIPRFKNRVTPEGDHLTEDPNGDWIDYADHEKFVAALIVALEEVEKENTELKARAEKAEASVGVLREALNKSLTSGEYQTGCPGCGCYPAPKPEDPRCEHGRWPEGAEASDGVCWWKDCHEALSSTAPAAQEWEARIRKEEREAAWERLQSQGPEFCFAHIKAAIMGSEGIDGPTGQSHKGEGNSHE